MFQRDLEEAWSFCLAEVDRREFKKDGLVRVLMKKLHINCPMLLPNLMQDWIDIMLFMFSTWKVLKGILSWVCEANRVENPIMIYKLKSQNKGICCLRLEKAKDINLSESCSN